MELELYLTPRMVRKTKRMAETIDFLEIWEYMNRYGMTGWYYQLGNIDAEKVSKQFEKIDLNVDYIISLGTGGSYQGVEMLVEFSKHKDKFIFVGPSLDPEEIAAITKKVEGKKIGFNIISKSGGTLEIIMFINLFKDVIKKSQWITIVSSNPGFSDFIIESFKEVKTIETFLLPANVGGRFAIGSIMGLVVCYLTGLNFQDFMKGFLDMRESLEKGFTFIPFERGIARYLLFSDGKILENLASNQKKIRPTLNWARQLWAESNGKEHKSMFISVGTYPEDAHSVGQIWKEGPRKVAETFFLVKNNPDYFFENKLSIQNIHIKKNNLNEINKDFTESIIEDRFESGIPVMIYRVNDFTLETWGKLVFSEMVAVVIEAYYLGVNPFNQPGVESYKEKVKARIL
ncbi:MAG: hypothetical protein A2Y41_14235 [Spirochaetes bacterium GWB1_36_13]|nr:MAG: hypothetical protein A2Y41_14235 [Spirochaetes bacterium GWB1_36_13]